MADKSTKDEKVTPLAGEPGSTGGSGGTGSNPPLPDANLSQIAQGKFKQNPETGAVEKTDGKPFGVYDNQLAQAAGEEAGETAKE